MCPASRSASSALLERVERAGFGTLVVTVDTPVSGNRENNIRAGFSTPLRPSLRLALDGITHPRWLCRTALRTLLAARHAAFRELAGHARRADPLVQRDARLSARATT